METVSSRQMSSYYCIHLQQNLLQKPGKILAASPESPAKGDNLERVRVHGTTLKIEGLCRSISPEIIYKLQKRKVESMKHLPDILLIS